IRLFYRCRSLDPPVSVEQPDIDSELRGAGAPVARTRSDRQEPAPSLVSAAPSPAKKSDLEDTLPKPSSKPVVATPARLTSPAGQRIEVLPKAPEVSLFDAMNRVKNDTLLKVREDIGDCTRCKLHRTRKTIVFADGNPKAELVFVGEGPGAD